MATLVSGERCLLHARSEENSVVVEHFGNADTTLDTIRTRINTAMGFDIFDDILEAPSAVVYGSPDKKYRLLVTHDDFADIMHCKQRG